MLDDAKNWGGHRKSDVAIEDFRRVINDMLLVDVKPDHGWFTWSNNKRGKGLVKGRIDRFLVSSSWLSEVPFLASEVVREAESDHDFIILDVEGRKPRGCCKDPRLQFHFEECWAKDKEAKKVIKEA